MPRTQLRARDFDPAFDRLTEVTGFGSNPGALRMFEYVPADPQPALVVVLHGCTQTAASYDFGAGWSTLADRHGFVLLLPEQQRANNANNCFNWFCAGDIERGRGEAMSIRCMVEKMIVDHGIDRRRVFITGLSAGGEHLGIGGEHDGGHRAAGAIIAGLPYGTATNVNEAFESMGQVRARSAREWGDLVRAASPHKGPWPRVSVWHGGADPVVKPENADEIIKQWTDVHGLDLAPTSTERVDGYPRQVWRNPAGQSVIESYTIPAMAHGTPLATGSSESTSKNNSYGQGDGTLILVAYRHGLRASEACDLRWEQIDWNSATLHVRRVKSGKPSTHPIRGDELRSLRKLQREAPKSPFVFVSERGGPFTTDSFNWMVKRAGQKADLPFQVHAHMLRHATGYKLAGDGHNTRSIQDYLGHKNIQHTVLYTELSPTRFKDFWRD